MKNLKKLSRNEMKTVLGGRAACATGQQLYSCTSSYNGGGSTTGSVCGTSSSGAASTVVSTYKSEGIWGDDGAYNQVACG